MEKNDVEAYIYWVLGEIIVVHHQKFQDLNNNKSYFCKFDGMSVENGKICLLVLTKDVNIQKHYFIVLIYNFIIRN